MILHGFCAQTPDIDLGCSILLADQVELQGYAVSLCKDGTRKILYSENTDIFENWIEGSVEIISGICQTDADASAWLIARRNKASLSVIPDFDLTHPHCLQCVLMALRRDAGTACRVHADRHLRKKRL